MKYLSLYSVGFILIMMLSFFSFYKKDILGRQGRLLQGLRQSPAGNSLFAETFEGPTPFAAVENTDFGTPYSFSVVSRPVYKGSKSARFELRDTDPMVSNGTRAEVTVVKDAVQREMWYSFAVYFPADDFAPDTKTEIISQWWQAGDNHLGEANSSPATALRIQNDRFILDTGYNDAVVSSGVIPESRKKISLGPVVKDTWHEFVFHFVHSYQADGLIEVWHNGAKLQTLPGGNMYNNLAMPKWKLGIYKWKWNEQGTTDTQKRVLYFDNIHVAKDQVTFAEMTPGRLH